MPGVPLAAHVGAASLNQTVGDWRGNRERIAAAIAHARERGVKLLALPEMCIPGYSLGDRLMMRGTLERSWEMLRALLPATEGLVVLLGLPLRHRDVVYNVVAVVADGALVGLVPKENLATGDVQYENRWFSGWVRGRMELHTTPEGDVVPFGSLLFEARGIGRFGVEVCEDGWKGIRPGSVYALAGAHIVANPSASWFVMGKHRVRRAMVEQISREDHVVYLYTSLLGCDATRLVFDGSVFVAQDGRVLEEGDRFVFGADMVFVERIVDLAGLQRARMEEGSWRQQVEGMQRGDHGALPTPVVVPGDFTTERPAPPEGRYWAPDPTPPSVDPSLDWLARDGRIPRAPTHRDLPHLELELALAMALSEYRRKCGIGGFALALSGGRDSAMCALLVARAFHYETPTASPEQVRQTIADRFVTAYMATENSGSATHEAARSLAEELGATFLDVGIQPAVDTHVQLCRELTGVQLSWNDPSHDITLQNVQARLRGSMIWMVANLRGLLLLSTSNKSEAAVGYATMDGDTSGGISPIADVPKSLVTLWLRWAADFHGLQSMKQVVGIPATAELRPPDRGQTDEDDLMPFDILDRLMYQFVQCGQEPLEMFRTLWPELSPVYDDDPRGLAAHIDRFVRLLCRAQWKRERFAISFRVTAFDLDPKTGFRFPPVQAPFTDELAELHAHVATMVDG
jgi:NAD+ synthase (glutamine-hydrolysing)